VVDFVDVALAPELMKEGAGQRISPVSTLIAVEADVGRLDLSGTKWLTKIGVRRKRKRYRRSRRSRDLYTIYTILTRLTFT